MKNLLLFLALTFPVCVALGQKGKAKQTASPTPFVLGVIDRLQSVELAEERVLNIYLPEGYDPHDTTTYPVIYLLDGSANEDFIHIVGLVQYYNFDWINQVPKSIVVGIASVDRERDFTFPTTDRRQKEKFPTMGKSARFIAFVEKELQPYMESTYRTNADKTIIGQSLGGLWVTEVLLTKPTLFNRYIIVSPSLWWDNGSLLTKKSIILTEDFSQQIHVYIGVGKEGVTPTEIPRVMEVDANLLADKLKGTKSKHVQVFFDYLPEENHATIMHQAVSNAFKYLHVATTNE